MKVRLFSPCFSLLWCNNPNTPLPSPFNAPLLLLCHAMLHLDTSSPSPTDLSSNVIPVDDDEDEGEETYDDIGERGASGPPPQPIRAAQGSKLGGRQEAVEGEEEDEDDIYEMLPGERMWLPRTHQHK